ncbi:MAG: diaminopimelate decarboxylase [Candidatus Margulisbacteria bacterium]|nr:diaminopimelate decarboxylase [Candidatus Margulisiibacteriota bacterium]
MKPLTAKINSKGHLEIGKIDALDLAKKHGTPLYVMDVATIKQIVKEYRTLEKYYPHTRIAFASKALSLTALYQLLDKEGLYFDVISDGEIFTLLNAGVSLKKAYFHGNNKTMAEIELALKNEIGCIVVDNSSELKRIKDAYTRLKMKNKINILFRVVPEIDAHTHEFIQTGKRDTKFGVLKEQLLDILDEALKLKIFNFQGLHAHIGSQIFDFYPFEVLIERLFNMCMLIYKEKKIVCTDISIGGGMGIKYTREDDPPAINEFIEAIARKLKAALKENKYPLQPTIILEPGRSIVANAGVTLYTIGAVKEIPDIRTFLTIDGGMADNPRPITYGAKYEADLAGKMKKGKNKIYSIAGKFCESGDILIRDISLPSAEAGDILAVYATGAYNYSMSSNYNRYRKPAMVFVENGKDTLVLKRETLRDIIRNDVKC